VAYTAPRRDRKAVCRVPNTERLEQMLDQAGFALLVLTAESERTDGVVLARQNVVHEAGLFQGRLGWRKAIVLREDGCEEFSNIAGLGQIPQREHRRVFRRGPSRPRVLRQQVREELTFGELLKVAAQSGSRNDARRRGSRNCCQLVRT
jgi:hypothetical protein